jgi:hypothetical protein
MGDPCGRSDNAAGRNRNVQRIAHRSSRWCGQGAYEACEVAHEVDPAVSRHDVE